METFRRGTVKMCETVKCGNLFDMFFLIDFRSHNYKKLIDRLHLGATTITTVPSNNVRMSPLFHWALEILCRVKTVTGHRI